MPTSVIHAAATTQPVTGVPPLSVIGRPAPASLDDDRHGLLSAEEPRRPTPEECRQDIINEIAEIIEESVCTVCRQTSSEGECLPAHAQRCHALYMAQAVSIYEQVLAPVIKDLEDTLQDAAEWELEADYRDECIEDLEDKIATLQETLKHQCLRLHRQRRDAATIKPEQLTARAEPRATRLLNPGPARCPKCVFNADGWCSFREGYDIHGCLRHLAHRPECTEANPDGHCANYRPKPLGLRHFWIAVAPSVAFVFGICLGYAIAFVGCRG